MNPFLIGIQLRKGFSLSGVRIYLLETGNGYRLATRDSFLTPALFFLGDALEIFCVLELCEGNLARAARYCRLEMKMFPRSTLGDNPLQRTTARMEAVENRQAGFRRRSAAKGAYRWVAACKEAA